MRHLSKHGVAYVRTDSANFNSLTSQDEASRVMSVMNGPVPIVYVNGKAKANPAPQEVVAEFRGGKAGWIAGERGARAWLACGRRSLSCGTNWPTPEDGWRLRLCRIQQEWQAMRATRTPRDGLTRVCGGGNQRRHPRHEHGQRPGRRPDGLRHQAKGPSKKGKTEWLEGLKRFAGVDSQVPKGRAGFHA